MTSVTYHEREGVARIRLVDGDRGNPLNQPTVNALARAVRRARTDDAHVVVLSSEGRTFSVGGDVSASAAVEDAEYLVDDLAESLHRVVSDLHRMDAVVVSVVRGRRRWQPSDSFARLPRLALRRPCAGRPCRSEHGRPAPAGARA